MNKITKDILEANFLSKAFRNPFKVMDEWLANILRKHFFANTQVNDNKILFATFNGAYNCNPKAILEEILKRKLPYEIVWVTKKIRYREDFPENIKLVPQASAEFYEEAASAKVWVSNSITMGYFGAIKKKTQKLIQTWHGSLGIKRFDTNSDKRWIKLAKFDAAQTDYCISNSQFEDDLFRNTYWKNSKILKFGHARNDILLKNDDEIEQIKNKLREKLNISKDTKVALYAPTFRDDKSFEHYDIDYELLKNSLTKKFGGDWVILKRMHYRLRKRYKNMGFHEPEFVIDANEIEDIQELLLITDVGITDYSSWICDYILLNKAGFLYTPDLKEYNGERGFYYPLEELPFPIAETNEQLADKILNFDESEFQEKREIFLQKRGCMEDGHAAERIADLIEEIMEK